LNANTGFAQAFVFTKTMSAGFSGAEVTELQKALNKSPDTQVATSGAGSPGAETTYFGPLTRAAVVRFQEKYKNEVLLPAGVGQGTGYVGTFTLKKLNELAVNSGNSYTSPVTTPATPTTATAPRIESISPPSGLDGTTITIHGSNFSTKNTLVTGWGTFTDVPSADGKTLTLTVNSQIPAEGKSLLLPLTYRVYVMANKQVSNESTFVLEKEPGITYVSDAERENIKKENIKRLNGETGGLLSKIIPQAHAQVFIPFGGRITSVEYTCRNGFIITVADRTKGPLRIMIYNNASVLYQYYQIYIPGPNVVGNILPTGICERNGANEYVFGAITIVGTSLPG
jgi:peptidoglycan hydrolase-like protein with peptidoglycan-binding domain